MHTADSSAQGHQHRQTYLRGVHKIRRHLGSPLERQARRQQSSLKRLLMSGYGTRSASPAKLPSDRKVVAARMKPVHAANASAPPTLMRRTPSAAISPTFTPMSLTTSMLSGFGATASTSVSISAGLCAPGAKSTSAPAAAYSCRRRTDSWSGLG